MTTIETVSAVNNTKISKEIVMESRKIIVEDNV